LGKIADQASETFSDARQRCTIIPSGLIARALLALQSEHKKAKNRQNRAVGMGGTRKRIMTFSALGLTALVVSGCDESGEFNLGQVFQGNAAQTPTVQTESDGAVVERDVEAPEVFSATEAGLWDGRPSLGGVWVAHPDVKDPERVIIRNTTNGQFVVGALFRREREIPGPRLQISSDAATSLGVLAGAPVELNVTALRREEVAVEPEIDPLEEPVEADTVAAAETIEEQPLDPIAAATAALDDLETDGTDTVVASVEPTAPAPEVATPAPAPTPASSLDKPFIQVGIFSVEANAERTSQLLRNAGVIPTIRKGDTNGKPFWRVIAGPSSTSSDRRALLGKIKDQGFGDAYAVSN